MDKKCGLRAATQVGAREKDGRQRRSYRPPVKPLKGQVGVGGRRPGLEGVGCGVVYLTSGGLYSFGRKGLSVYEVKDEEDYQKSRLSLAI